MYLSSHHVRFIKRFLFLLIPYSLLRIGFYFYHLNIYKQFTSNEIFESFFLGMRFDIAAILLLNVPIILLSLVPSNNPKFLNFERVLFVLLNFFGIVAALNDYELFLFMGKRLSFDFFVIAQDIVQQLPQVFLYYWYLPIVAVLWAIGFYYFDRKFFRIKGTNPKLQWHVVSSFFILALSFVGIRGGLQHKSINVQSAFSQGKNELGHLVLNTPYHFLRTLKNKSVERVKYFKTDEEALNVLLNRRDLTSRPTEKKKYNIVLIILESFASEYVEKGYAPFLSELQRTGVNFPYHLANGRRSIEALPSLLCALPALLDEPISKSIFQGNKFVCMPKLLKELGYTNHFFHGGAKGTMGFESYTLANGFDRYFSRDDHPDRKDDDGTWGIYDEPYFQFFADSLGKMPRPFFGSIFTLSSHHPYAVPEKYRGKFPKGTLEIHESIGYADHALRGFFEKARKQDWFKDTVFIITSDHSQKLETKKYQNTIGHFRVPLVIVTPEDLGLQTQKVSQHSDIPKTVLELVGGKSDQLPATGVSLLGQDKGYALNYADGQEYLLIGLEEVLKLTRGREQVSFTYDWETGLMSPETPSQDPLLKAYLQYFVNGLIGNNLSLYR